MDSTQVKPSNVTVKNGAVVEYSTTVIRGTVTIDKGTVVHPTVQILADGGPILIGANNLLEEGVVIHNKKAEDDRERTMVIGDQNVFEVRSHCEALNIGNNNVLEMKAFLGQNVTLTNGCIIGVGVRLDSSQIVPEKTEIYISDGMIKHRSSSDIPQPQNQQLEYLRNMIPNYHKIRKPSKTLPVVGS